MHEPHGAPSNPHASPTPPNSPSPYADSPSSYTDSSTPYADSPAPYADPPPPHFPPPPRFPTSNSPTSNSPYPSPYTDAAPADLAPTHLTYPWQPRTPPVAVRPRRRAGPALGRHSDIRILRSAYKWLRRVATLTALGYFTLFLVLSAYAPGLMTLRVDGGLSAGLLLGVCQLPVTLVALAVYEWRARRAVDPLSERLRRQSELEARR